MRKYIIYDNYGNIINMADSEPELRQIWKDTKVDRILTLEKEFNMGLAELSEDELKNMKIDLSKHKGVK